MLSLQKFNASKMDPLNKRFSSKLQYPKKKMKAIDPQKKSEKVAVPKVTLASENIYNIVILKKRYT